MYNSESRKSREISLNSSLEAIYVHHMLPDTTYTIQMSAVSRKGVGVRSQLIVIGNITASLVLSNNGHCYFYQPRSVVYKLGRVCLSVRR